MPGRILNFSEFFDKYSKDSGDNEKNLDSFTQSSSNFEEGFDKETYDKTPLGPNKPVATGSGMTPAAPGEAGAPAFSSKHEEEMSAPEETAEETSEEDVEETPEPEAGANPKNKEKEESKSKNESAKVKGFNQFVNEMHPSFEMPSRRFSRDEDEMHETCPNCGGELENTGLDAFCPECEGDRFAEKGLEHSSCTTCGEPYDEYGSSCGCNM